MVSAWEAVRDRRSQPRHRVRLRASVSRIDSSIGESEWPSVLAHTVEISRSGLALIVPSSSMECIDPSEGEYLLRIILAISSVASVKIDAAIVHCSSHDAGQAEPGYLTGVRIERINTVGRLLYDEFIKSLTWRG